MIIRTALAVVALLLPFFMVKYATALLIGFLIPTLTLEAYKLFELVGHGYLANWQQLFNWIKAQGMPSSIHVNVLLLRQRIALVHDSFGVNLIGLVALIAFGMLLYWRSASKNWISLSAGLLLSVATTATYWATLSVGIARYLVIEVAMGAFLLAVPIFTLELWPKLFFALLTLVLLRTGFSRAGYSLHLADHGLFKPTTDRTTRVSLVGMINPRKKEAPTILASTWWGSFADVEFLLPDT